MPTKEYYQKHKKECLQKSKEYYLSNREKILTRQKDYNQRNKEKILSYQKSWEQDNEQRKQYLKNYREKNKDKMKKSSRYFYLQNKKRWIPILENIFGELKCSSCGYDKSFSGLHFHHIKGDKKYTPAKMLKLKPTPERTKEFKKCKIICANCHAEETWGLGFPS